MERKDLLSPSSFTLWLCQGSLGCHFDILVTAFPLLGLKTKYFTHKNVHADPFLVHQINQLEGLEDLI